jgi:Flp pilus assembly protein TadB
MTATLVRAGAVLGVAGPSALLAGSLAGGAAAVAIAGRVPVGERLRVLLPRASASYGAPSGAGSRSAVRLAAAVAAGAGVVALLGVVAFIPALLVAVGVHRALPSAAAVAAAADEQRIRADAPLVCDLLAAALTAGAPTIDAVTLVARAVGGASARLFGDVAASLALGAPPAEAWAAVERSPPLRQVARAAVRSASSGAALAGALTALADDLRQAAHAEGQVAARRAGVRLVGPLTLCFLPSFVVLGVVPLVVGLLPDVLG